MKNWISPPIQWLFWLMGLLILAGGAWSVFNLLNLTEELQAENKISVEIPDMSVLSAPDIMSYRYIVESPLFWSTRQIAQKRIIQPIAQDAAPAPAPEIDKTLPEGRLVGIVDLGKKKFAMMSSPTETHHLYAGDQWGNWKVDAVEKSQLVLTLNSERQVIPLIGDFSAPKENPKIAENREAAEQQKLRDAALAKLQARPAPQAAAVPEPKAGMPNDAFPAEVTEQVPILSIKDALEARRRLMASRWGNITGDAQPAAPDKKPSKK